MSAGNECITVVVRCRPMNKKENDEKRGNIIEVDADNRQIGIKNPDTPSEPPKYFTYDATYDANTQQKVFYEESCFSIIESTLEGFNSTIFAYGQTGCGKSFTMQGPSTTDENMRGVIPNSFFHIFQFVKSTKNIEFLIRCSYLELYNEEIRDLLIDPKLSIKCELHEDPNKGVYVKGLSDVVVESPEDLHKMLDKGLSNRTVASTLMNSESSRSHSVFTIIVEMSTKDETTGKDMLRVGKLNLVDLAGSERAKKTGATDKTLKEGIKINLSLTALGNVISALAEGGKFVPYRDSKLTRLLQDSLGGNTKTMMVAAISPADYNYEETLSTLRYANRAKNIKNKPKINEDPKDAMIREFKAEIERLRKLLADQSNAATMLAQLQGSGSAQQISIQSQPMSQQSSQQQLAHGRQSQEFLPAVKPQEEQAVVILGSDQQDQPQSQPQAFPRQLDVIEEAFSETLSPQKPSAPTAVSLEGGFGDFIAPTSMPNSVESEGFSVGNPLLESEVSVQKQFTPKASAESSPRVENQNVALAPVVPVQQPIEMVTTPRDMEQQIRDEIENRLHQLEHMLVGSEEQLNKTSSAQQMSPAHHAYADENYEEYPADEVSEVPDSNSTVKVRSSTITSLHSPVAAHVKTAEQIAEEERAQQLYKERKLKAKKRREEKQQKEMQKVLDEKKQIEEELEDLKQSLLNEKLTQQQVATQQRPTTNAQSRPATNPSNKDTGEGEDELDEFAAKKLARLKKRYEKKLSAAKEDLEALRDDFYYQRKQLMDAMLEQEKDAKLYELICRSLLSDKDLRKIVEKSKYDDEKDEWIIPLIKRKNYDDKQFISGSVGSSTLSGTSNIGGSSGGGGSSFLPNINNPKDNPLGNANLTTKSLDQKFSSTLPANSWAINTTLEPVEPDDRPVSQSKNKRNRIPSANKYKEKNTNNNDDINSNNSSSSNKIPIVPLLTLPGSLVSVSSLMGNQISSGRNGLSSRNEDNDYSSNYNNNNNSSNAAGGGFSLPGIGFQSSTDNEEKKKANKSKNKLPKSLPTSSSNSANNNYNDNNNAYSSNSSRLNYEQDNGNSSSNSSNNNNRMPNIHAKANNYSSSTQQKQSQQQQQPQQTDYSMSNVDEIGSGENAGPLQDWGFAGGNKNSMYQEIAPEDYDQGAGEFEDNENYPNNNVKQTKKKSKSKDKEKDRDRDNDRLPSATNNNNSAGRMFPPIGSTPRGGGGLTLPPI